MKLQRSFWMLVVLSLAPWALVATNAGGESAAAVPKLDDSPEAVIARALGAPVSVDFRERSFKDVVAQLEKDWKISILVDYRSLADEGIASDTPVNLKVSDISAQAALNLLLHSLDLDWKLRGDSVWIADREALEPQTKVYPVADLVGPLGKDKDEERTQEIERLVQMIASTITPPSWDNLIGPLAMDVPGTGKHALVVRQRRPEHETIGALLHGLRTLTKRSQMAVEAVAADAPKSNAASVISVSPDMPSEVAIRHALAKRVTVRCAEKPLRDLTGQLAKEWEIPIVLDERALNEVGVNSDTPVTLDVAGISARSALEIMLKPLDLSWMVYNEVLWITTPEEIQGQSEIKIYDITDLVTENDKIKDSDGQSLIELITKTVWPDAWDAVGGPGRIAIYSRGNVRALVVCQFRQVHEDIAALLDDLRAVCRAGAAKD